MIRYTAALLLFLLIPLAMKMLFRGREIYPSVVMPAGVAVIRLDNEEMAFRRLQVFGYDEVTGELKAIDHEEWMSPAPIHFLGRVSGNDFGLGGERNDPETLEWWKEKLRDQGCSDEAFVSRLLEVKAPSMNESILSEKEYVLAE